MYPKIGLFWDGNGNVTTRHFCYEDERNQDAESHALKSKAK